MSFGFRDRVNRDKPRLSDRFRGKSGDEILEELRKDFAKRKQMFFDTAPRSSGFMKQGFPFDDETRWRRRGDTDLRHHLDDIAQRYPQFADQLRDWSDESPSGMGWGSQQAQPETSAPQQSHATETEGTQLHEQVPQQPAGEGDARNQRAMSAPPDSRAKDPPQRFVSRLEINPNAPSGEVPQPAQPQQQPTQTPQPQPQTSAQPQSQQQQADPKKKPATVRHIPIFVEGRNETVMPKDVDMTTADFGQSFGSPPRHRDAEDGYHAPAFAKYAPSGFGGFMNSPFQSYQRKSPFMRDTVSPQHHPQPQPQPHHSYTHAQPQQQHAHHHTQPQQQYTHPHAQHQQPQQHHYPREHQFHQQQAQPTYQQPPPAPSPHPQPHPQQQQPPHPEPKQQTPPRQPAPKVEPKDPLQQVAEVQKDVDELMKQVEVFTGTRQDKQYIYLDEMLTRNLLKLDLVETEGKENVRAARKATIKCITQGISLLESKTMTPEELAEREKAMEVDEPSDDQTMEVSTEGEGDAATLDQTKMEESAPTESVASSSSEAPAPSAPTAESVATSTSAEVPAAAPSETAQPPAQPAAQPPVTEVPAHSAEPVSAEPSAPEQETTTSGALSETPQPSSDSQPTEPVTNASADSVASTPAPATAS